jgi:hypothetical protein
MADRHDVRVTAVDEMSAQFATSWHPRKRIGASPDAERLRAHAKQPPGLDACGLNLYYLD